MTWGLWRWVRQLRGRPADDWPEWRRTALVPAAGRPRREPPKDEVKKWAVCLTDFPFDGVEDERAILVPSGRNIAEALLEMLAKLGCEPGDLSEEGDHGWQYLFTFEGRRFLGQVTDIGHEVLLLFDKSYGRERGPGPSPHAVLLEKIQAAIAKDRRFRKVTWYTQYEMDTVDWELPPEEPEAARP